ncbi:hypothetical protein RJ55_05075 [Drechmeria coniospora]|nr:hypothetical protein RJ55_05075 [Drechmeria coniospora]
MPSFLCAVLSTVATLASVAQADYSIDPKSVSASIRQAWCQSERATCPIICQQTGPGTTLVNTCDPDLLTYGCLCGDNKRPNVSEYSLTLPYFICQEWGNQCVKACGSNNKCSSDCREKNPCGAQEPKKYTSTAEAPAATSTDANAIYTNLPGGPATMGSSGAAVAVEAGRSYSLAVVLAGLFAGFAML